MLLEQKPHISRGKVYPMSARKLGITVEDILRARKNHSPGFGKKRKVQSKSNKKQCFDDNCKISKCRDTKILENVKNALE